MFRNLSIKFKLFLTYAAVSLLVLSISFTLFYFEVQKELKQRIKEELTQSNHIITDMVETSARVSIKNHLRAIAEKNREIVAHIYETFQKGLLTESQAVDQAVNVLLSQTVGETGYIYCIDSSGTAVVHHEKGVEGQNYAYREFIQKQIKYKKGYLEYNWKNPDELKARPKALYMAYFEPWDWIITASSYKSEFSSLISIVDFKDQIRRLNFGDSGYSFICDTQGNVLIHPELTRLVFDENTRAGEVIQKIIQQEKGFLSYMWKNPSEKHAREKFIAFEPILNFNWIVASSSYKEEIFSTLDKIKNFFWIVLLMAFIIIAGVTLTVSATITEPLIHFIQFLEKAAKQSQDNKKSLDSRIDEVRSDEIGKLYKSFNLFMEKLDSYSKELISEIKMRKKTENELYHLQSYLSNIINSMPSVLIGIDMEKSITQWNKKAEELTRTARSDALGKPLPDIFPWIQTHMPLVEKSLDTKKIQQISRLPMEMEHTDPTYHDITIYPLFDQGLQGAVILIKDVTEKVKIQEVLIQNEKMISVG
ncbi:MAG: cache domain-containing protein, partial [Desulfobacteraceae bacterium]